MKNLQYQVLEHLREHSTKYLFGVTALIIVASLAYNFNPLSRRTFNPRGKSIEYTLPNDFRRMINVSSGGSEGDVMITYENLEGKLITKEYNRAGLFETTIHWKGPDKK